jgi:hypothetical protein
MSFKALAWAFAQDDLRNPEKSVLIALAYRDNRDEPHGCFPSLARVAKDCGLDRSTVVRCLQVLISQGKIHRKARTDAQGDKATSVYSFPLVWGVGANNAYLGASNTYPGADKAEGRCTQHRGVGANCTIEPKDLTVIEAKDECLRRKLEIREKRKRLDEELRARRFGMGGSKGAP